MLKMIMGTPEDRSEYSSRLSLPHDNNYEILNGTPNAIPVPGIKHQRISIKLTAILFQRLENRDLGTVMSAPCNVMLSPWDIVRPDVLFIRKNRKGIIGERIILGPPDLVVEILSDDTWEQDMKAKRNIYADSGVQEYWIVDPEAETVEPHIWSELGYISAGVCDKGKRLSSPLLPYLRLPLLKVFDHS